MAITDAQWNTIERRSGVPRHVMEVLLNRGERSAQSSVSPAGAFGRAQLMPSTAASLSRQYGVNPHTEFGNVLLGAMYLGSQYRTFGNWREAFAAYNAGGGAVKKYGGVPPFKEAQDYVRGAMAALGQPGSVRPAVQPVVSRRDSMGMPSLSSTLGAGGLPSGGLNIDKLAQASQQSIISGDFNPLAEQQQI